MGAGLFGFSGGRNASLSGGVLPLLGWATHWFRPLNAGMCMCALGCSRRPDQLPDAQSKGRAGFEAGQCVRLAAHSLEHDHTLRSDATPPKPPSECWTGEGVGRLRQQNGLHQGGCRACRPLLVWAIGLLLLRVVRNNRVGSHGGHIRDLVGGGTQRTRRPTPGLNSRAVTGSTRTAASAALRWLLQWSGFPEPTPGVPGIRAGECPLRPRQYAPGEPLPPSQRSEK